MRIDRTRALIAVLCLQPFFGLSFADDAPGLPKAAIDGTGCEPHSGVLALESEGSPVEFKNVRIRELP